MELHHSASTTEVDLCDVCELRLVAAVLERGIPHVGSAEWSSAAESLEPLWPCSTSTYRGGGSEGVLVDLGSERGEPCLAAVTLGRGKLSAWVAAGERPVVDEVLAWLRELLPEAGAADDSVPISFWTSFVGGDRSSRAIEAAPWADVRPNYPAATALELDTLMGLRPVPGQSGQLILWHGSPGTGKTTAARTLAWEWRDWCDVDYVTDPEVLLGGPANYLMTVLLDEDADPDRWRLLLLEDTGELLSADAKERTGQGLSRLLNVADGIIGQGLRRLVLVTTNEPAGVMHPAVVRPGRCLAKVLFRPFSGDEAAAWLHSHGVAAPDPTAATLAELYAHLRGDEPAPAPRPVGFVR